MWCSREPQARRRSGVSIPISRRLAFIVATTSLVCVGAACSSSASSSAGSSSTSSSATSSPPTSEGSTTTSTTVPQTVQYGGAIVTVTYEPDSGPPGTHVEVTGSGFGGQAAQIAQNDAYRFYLDNEATPPSCELIGQSQSATASIAPSGALSGTFIVPSTGSCFQQVNSTRPLSPGRYTVLLGAHAASLGTFTVTAS